MKVSLLNPNNYKKSVWNGGQTTELFIFPKESSYQERNFQIRISVAQVKDPISQFTHLQGIQRNLLLLEGCLLLSVQTKGEQLVLPGDEISFDGGTKIDCKGKGTDFNVMTNGNQLVSCQYQKIETGERLQLDQSNAGQLLFFYVHDGSIVVSINEREYQLKQEMSLMVDTLNEEVNIFLYATHTTHLVLAEVLR
jgi:uncharacterized protein